jgi:hypothetical protein
MITQPPWSGRYWVTFLTFGMLPKPCEPRNSSGSRTPSDTAALRRKVARPAANSPMRVRWSQAPTVAWPAPAAVRLVCWAPSPACAAAKVDRTTTDDAAARTSARAAIWAPKNAARRGTARRADRIVPDEYSALTAKTAKVTTASWPIVRL